MNKSVKLMLKTAWQNCKLTKRFRYPMQDASNGLRTYKTGSDTAYAIIRKNTQKIVIDATDSRVEWLQNIAVRRSGKWDSHIGFYRPALKFFKMILPSLDITRTVYIEGHSRGGSIGVLLCALLCECGYNAEVITFGSPKTGGEEHVKQLKGLGFKCTRVEIDGDPVCNLPPSTFREWCHYSTDEYILDYDYIGGSLVRNYVKHGMYGDALNNY